MAKRYVICGLSNRGLGMYVNPLLEGGYGGQVVAVVDPDADRVAAFNAASEQDLPCYSPAEFDLMVDQAEPEAVIVASPDVTHHDYIIAALERDLDVIAEKPLTATAAQAADVLDAEKRSRGSVRVAHNFRYPPRHRQIKRMISDGLIGRVVAVNLAYSVDTRHGSSYFYRWNRRRSISGGLSVHKSCHHIDLVSWWLDDQPAQVFGYGALNYYGPGSPHNPGRELSAAEQRQRCPYERHLASLDTDPHQRSQALPYPVQYPSELYIYDDEIDIEDTYSAVLRYRGGASMTYSLTFSAPWEGYRVCIDGTHGRIETTVVARGRPAVDTVTYYPLFGPRQVHDAAAAAGGHGGGDPALRRDLFTDDATETRELGCPATSEQGAYAVAAGEAMWRSICDNKPVDVAALLETRR